MNEKPAYEDLVLKIVELEQKLRKKNSTEEKLNSEKEWFESLTANIPGAVYRCECEKDWKMYYISDVIEDISGYKASDFIDEKVRKYSSIVHPEDRKMVEDTVMEAVENKKSYTIEFRLVDSKGEIHWIFERGRGVFDKDGDIVWLDGAIFDITDKKKAEQEREKLLFDLQTALENVKKLSGLLPICAQCKKVRDDKGYWLQIESYLEKNSEALLSHSLCPSCVETLYGKKEWFIKKENKEEK